MEKIILKNGHRAWKKKLGGRRVTTEEINASAKPKDRERGREREPEGNR